MTTITLEPTEIAETIRQQIGLAGFMTLGAHNLRVGNVAATRDAKPLPSLVANVRILPFNAKGKRLRAARIMQMIVSFDSGADLYNVTVSYLDRSGQSVTHYKAEGLGVEKLRTLGLALDYDGATVLNPRYV